jgi:two-component system chemotaxis sensor kinase CheA
MELDLETREFLIESNENLAILDRDVLALEGTPEDPELISGAFRAIHTIKGTCGFFGYEILGSVTHHTENLLSQVREGERAMNSGLVSLILESLDAVRILLNNIEQTGAEGEDFTGPIRKKLETAAVLIAEVPAAQQSSPSVLQPRSAPNAETESLPEEPAAETEHQRIASFPTPAIQEEENAGSKNASELTQNAKENSRDAHLSESTIRVDVGLLNKLMNLVGELVLARNQLLQETPALNPALQQTSQRLNLITSELQEGVMKTRMQPIGVVWNKFPRVVRDLAAKCGKSVRIEMEGAETELDKTIIEAIKDPLTHIVRNSCDHGIESPELRRSRGKDPEGVLLLRAYHEGGVVNIEISDDGAGIDPARVKTKALEKGLIRPEQASVMSDRDAMHLIFLPGFSTAAQITSVSGRGVGMDVVKTNIEKIGGSVELLRPSEGGTSIRIKIPLTLAIIPGLIVALERSEKVSPKQQQESCLDRFIIPQANLLELVRIEHQELKRRIENVHGTPVFHHRGRLLPLVYLAKLLGRRDIEAERDAINVVVLQAENKQLGLVVDRISDTQEIVVKPLGRQLKGLTCYVGATIMGDGKPALILDVAGLARLAGLGNLGRAPGPIATESVQNPDAGAGSPQMLLLFRTITYQRVAVALSLVDRLEEIKPSRLEWSGGVPVLNYRGEILPLVTLSGGAEWKPMGAEGVSSPLQVVVFSDNGRRIGLVVEQVLDIVNENVSIRRPTTSAGLLGSAVIGGRVTDLLDLNHLVRAVGQNWLGAETCDSAHLPKVLLIEKSAVARELLAEFLKISGFHVTPAASVAEATMTLQQAELDAILVSTRQTDANTVALLDHLRSNPQPTEIPVLELVDSVEQMYPDSPFSVQLVRDNLASLPDVIRGVLSDARLEGARR